MVSHALRNRIHTSHALCFLRPRPHVHTPHALQHHVHAPHALHSHVHTPQALRPRTRAPTPTPTPPCSATSCLAPPPPVFPHPRSPRPESPSPRSLGQLFAASFLSLGFAEAFWKLAVPSRRLAVSKPSPCFTSVCFASNKTSLVTNLAQPSSTFLSGINLAPTDLKHS